MKTKPEVKETYEKHGPYNRQRLGAPRRPSTPPATRVILGDASISVQGWPSRGGLIVLSHATAVDFDFLELDRVAPPRHRDPSQAAEDRLCQRLLLLGARWFDSLDRYGYIAGLEDGDGRDVATFEAGDRPAPTRMDTAWVGVAFPGGDPGNGFWVAEFVRRMLGGFGTGSDNLVPLDAARVSLAKTMDEKCQILQGLGAKFYSNPDEYVGNVCLDAWKWKSTGEVGPLESATVDEDEEE